MTTSRLHTSPGNSLYALVFIAQVLGALLFAKGFFPLNEPAEGYGIPLQNKEDTISSRGFDRLVFVLIDALRTDFMFSDESNMKFSQNLVREGKAIPYTANAQSPTVTLPRLKAMTSGVNPQFIDAVWNIDDSSNGRALLGHTDTWVRQVIFGLTSESKNDQNQKHGKRRALFYGDDTWLRLFPPDWFEEHDGVSSFYVTDTEIVDYNVTRHLDDVLSDKPMVDWDVLILHYLGLDHVGHLGGARSPLMGPKQSQLDNVISRLYLKASSDFAETGLKTLLVVAGDHGMTDAGNHGGSSDDEVSAALLFASPSFNLPQLNSAHKIKPKRVQQMDIVPTLSVLFQAGIPPASIGVAIESVFEATFSSFSNVTTTTLLVENVLRHNAIQLAKILVSSTNINSVYSMLPLTKQNATFPELEHVLSAMHVDQIRSFLRQVQGRLLEQFSGHNFYQMVTGLLILLIVSACFIIASIQCSPTFLGQSGAFIWLSAFSQLVSLFSSSFIEEEHEAWFFLSSTSLLVLAIWPTPTKRTGMDTIPKRIGYVAASAIVRILRGWSHNGQKATQNHSMSYLLQSSPWALHILDFTGFLILLIFLRPSDVKGVPNCLAYVAVSLAGFLTLLPSDHSYSNVFGTNMDLASHDRFRAIYILLLLSMSVSFLGLSRRQSHRIFRLVYLVFLRSMTRPINYFPLWLAFFAPDLIISSHIEWPNHKIFSHFRLQTTTSPESLATDVDRYEALILAWVQLAFIKCTFFAFGGSNSLATVDLSNAYNGITSYSLPIVTILTFLSNFAGPICISLGCTLLRPYDQKQVFSSKAQMIRVHLSAYQSIYLFIICLIGTAFSEHLFVYTVFSPAVLYGFVWTFFHYFTMIIDYTFF
ncbi:alkaline-phosphatase-like protein [Melampsora americana]|nr:alkaline-phosphatase-like protein [Melampsora americana]